MPAFTTRDDMLTWLGPEADKMTDEQTDQFARAADTIDGRWPDPDDRGSRERALSAALQVIIGDDTLEGIALNWKEARRSEREQMDALTGALIASSGSERELVERSGAARMTVRKALGR